MLNKVIILFMCLLLTMGVHGQNVTNKKIKVTTNKTTFLIFPNEVKFFDRGSEDIGVEKTENTKILRLKAASQNFKETNLTVMCEGEKFYSFLINYAPNPDTLNYILKSPTDPNPIQNTAAPVAVDSGKNASKADKLDLPALCDKLLKLDAKTVTGIRKYKMVMALNGIFVKGNKLFFNLEFTNQSNIDFEIDYLKFNIKNQKRYTRAAFQEVEVQPVYVQNGSHNVIKAGSSNIKKVFVADKFTIPDKKELVIELGEMNGDRNLSMTVSGNTLLEARRL